LGSGIAIKLMIAIRQVNVGLGKLNPKSPNHSGCQRWKVRGKSKVTGNKNNRCAQVNEGRCLTWLREGVNTGRGAPDLR